MPRRPAPRTTTLNNPADPPLLDNAPPALSLPNPTQILRTHWKWAAFSQFYFTFSPLCNAKEVTIEDIEQDLVNDNNIFLPRVMQKMLYTLTYDRKVSLDNWQTALRKQYYRREPFANPIGPESLPADDKSRHVSVVEEEGTPEPREQSITAREDTTEGINETLDNTPAPGSTHQNSPQPGESKEFDGQERTLIPKKFRSLLTEEQALELEKQETKNWLDLSMLEKLDSMHLVTEWMFQNPNRVRHLMRDDDETATWRIEPIGYDSKQNAYWLIGADRLWIQRTPPKPPRPTTGVKRKRGGASEKKSSRKVKKEEPAAKKRKAGSSAPTTTRGGRAAKAQANVKLEKQAKQLAELNRQAAIQANSQKSPAKGGRRKAEPAPLAKAASSSARATRLSARLKSGKDGWEAVPDEWLDAGSDTGDQTASTSKSAHKTGLESDADTDSDLTELTEDSEIDEADSEANDEEPLPDPVSAPPLLLDFIEWETIAVTLYEWEHVADPWAKATHYAEKALYKVLTKTIAPVILEELREASRKRKLEEAIVHRKRSSRIAIKENKQEEAKAEARQRAEEDEKMGRARRAEARQMKEEQDREKREAAREQRRLEREAKEARELEEQENAKKAAEAINHEPLAKLSKPKPHAPRTNGRRRKASEDWELDCEVCYRHGINIDDETPLMSCGMCGKWQHINCHDRVDQQAGRPPRNWAKTEFYCRHCRLKQGGYGLNGGVQNGQAPPPYVGPSYHHQHLPAQISPYPPQIESYAGSYATPVKGYTQHLSDVRGAPESVQKGISFAHYQPQQRGFSSNVAPLAVPHYNNNNGSGTYNPMPSRYPTYPISNGQGSQHYERAQYPSQWQPTPAAASAAAEIPTSSTPQHPQYNPTPSHYAYPSYPAPGP